MSGRSVHSRLEAIEAEMRRRRLISEDEYPVGRMLSIIDQFIVGYLIEDTFAASRAPAWDPSRDTPEAERLEMLGYQVGLRNRLAAEHYETETEENIVRQWELELDVFRERMRRPDAPTDDERLARWSAIYEDQLRWHRQKAERLGLGVSA